MGKHILITGVAGFIGYHLAIKLMYEGFIVTGVDNLNDYYDPILKNNRLKNLNKIKNSSKLNFNFYKLDISQIDDVNNLFTSQRFDIVINLAAQAGVRHSIDEPFSYLDSNLLGFLNILEGCRKSKPEHLIFASSSSVYGMSKKIPFSVSDNTDQPVSLYAATKKSNELMAHSYSHLYDIPITGLRFFTVYGPYGRPDMAYFKFTKAILKEESIEVYNGGNMERDFTYIDDIVQGIYLLLDKKPELQSSESSNALARFKIYNIGNNNPVSLSRFIKAIENAVGKNSSKINLPMQPGDVPITYANIDDLVADVGFTPKTEIEDGIKKFVDWYKIYLIEESKDR